MLELKDGFVLYHGSYCEVKEPELDKCAKRKDFGQGFYLTSSKEQAESFLRTSLISQMLFSLFKPSISTYFDISQ